VSIIRNISAQSDDGFLQSKLHHERLDVFEIDQTTIDDIISVGNILSTCIEECIDELYAFFETNPLASMHFEGVAIIEHAKIAHEKHWRRLLQVKFDHEYFMSVEASGRNHAKLKIPLHLFMAAYPRMLNSIGFHASSNGNTFANRHLQAFNKIVAFDMELSLEAYFNQKFETLEANISDLTKLHHHMKSEQSD